jgi:hypothetical protein
LDLLGAELFEDVVVGGVVVPAVRWLGEGVVDGLFVPLDAGVGVLVLMLHAEDVAELV